MFLNLGLGLGSCVCFYSFFCFAFFPSFPMSTSFVWVGVASFALCAPNPFFFFALLFSLLIMPKNDYVLLFTCRVFCNDCLHSNIVLYFYKGMCFHLSWIFSSHCSIRFLCLSFQAFQTAKFISPFPTLTFTSSTSMIFPSPSPFFSHSFKISQDPSILSSVFFYTRCIYTIQLSPKLSLGLFTYFSSHTPINTLLAGKPPPTFIPLSFLMPHPRLQLSYAPN